MRQPMTAPIPLLFSLAGMWGPLHSLACSPNFSLRSCSDVLDGPAAAAFLQLPLSPSSFPLLSSHLSPSLPCSLSLSPTCAAPVRHRDSPCTRASPRRCPASRCPTVAVATAPDRSRARPDVPPAPEAELPKLHAARVRSISRR
jgi:hypothetical protein